MGNKWRFGLIILAGVVAVFITWRSLSHPPQPVYQNRTLASWIQDLPASRYETDGIELTRLNFNADTQKQLAAEDAVRHIGTNALPYLLSELHAKASLHEQLMNIWEDAKRIGQKASSLWFSPPLNKALNRRTTKTSGEKRHWDAARGLHALGPLARPVLPQLTNILNHQASDVPAAAYALVGMGPEGLAAMRTVLTNRPRRGYPWAAVCVLWAWGQTPEIAQQELPLLLVLLHDTNPQIRHTTTWVLGEIPSNSVTIAPALAANLGDSTFTLNMQRMTKSALAQHGINKFTLPDLQSYTTNSELHIRMAATNALIALYPEAVPQTGLK